MSHYARGEAPIDEELVSDQNEFFVLHDSKGFEAGDDEHFKVVARFLEERRFKKSLKDRLHAIWYVPTLRGVLSQIHYFQALYTNTTCWWPSNGGRRQEITGLSP